MATTGIIRGRDYVLHNNAVQITHLTSCEMTLGAETIDVTTSDSADWKDSLPGDKSWGFSATANVAMDAAENIDELTSDWNSNGTVTVLLTTGTTGDSTYTGSARITNITVSNPRDGVSTLSISYEGTDALTIGVAA